MARIIKPIRFTIVIMVVLSLLLGGGYKVYQVGKNMLGFNYYNFEILSTIAIENSKHENRRQLTNFFQNNVVVYHDNSIRAYNLKGEEQWHRSQNMQSPLLRSSQNILFLVDREIGVIQAMNNQGEVLWTVDISSPVADFSNNLQGKSAVIVQTEQGGGVIHTFDEEGKAVGKTIINKGSVMATLISDDGEIMAVSLLSVDNNKIETNIVLYSMAGKLLGGNKYDDEIITNMFYSIDNNLISVGTDHVVCFHKGKGLLWSKSIPYAINKLSWNNENLLALNLVSLRKTITNKTENRIRILDEEGSPIYEVEIKDSIHAMDSMGSIVVAAGNRTIYYIDSQLDKMVERKINNDIEDIQFISEDQLMVITKGKIEIMRLK